MRADICVKHTPDNSAAIVAVCKSIGMKYNEPYVARRRDHYDHIGMSEYSIVMIGLTPDGASDRKVVSLEEFIAAMLDQGPKPKITKIEGNSLTYAKDSVRVGCTTVTREQVEGVLEHMNALRDKK